MNLLSIILTFQEEPCDTFLFRIPNEKKAEILEKFEAYILRNISQSILTFRNVDPKKCFPVLNFSLRLNNIYFAKLSEQTSCSYNLPFIRCRQT